jgi:hypothetical protein
MEQHDILGRIESLVEQERDLRTKLQHGEIAATDEHEQLRQVEAALDQCWDLLRQRRARIEMGQDPGGAEVRPITQVEGYQQ